MGHAHDDGVDAQVRAAVNQRLHARDQRLAPLQEAGGRCSDLSQEVPSKGALDTGFANWPLRPPSGSRQNSSRHCSSGHRWRHCVRTSRPKRLAAANLFARKLSNISLQASRSRMWIFFSGLYLNCRRPEMSSAYAGVVAARTLIYRSCLGNHHMQGSMHGGLRTHLLWSLNALPQPVAPVSVRYVHELQPNKHMC